MNVTFRLPSEDLEKQFCYRGDGARARRPQRPPLGRRNPRVDLQRLSTSRASSGSSSSCPILPSVTARRSHNNASSSSASSALGTVRRSIITRSSDDSRDDRRCRQPQELFETLCGRGLVRNGQQTWSSSFTAGAAPPPTADSPFEISNFKFEFLPSCFFECGRKSPRHVRLISSAGC